MSRLTALDVKNESTPGRHTGGHGLHLHVRPGGQKGWVLRLVRVGRLRDMGLGG